MNKPIKYFRLRDGDSNFFKGAIYKKNLLFCLSKSRINIRSPESGQYAKLLLLNR